MLVALTNLMRLCLKRKAPTQPHLPQRGRMTKESGCRTVSVRHPNGAPQIPPLRFAPVGMTKRRGLLKGRGPWPRDTSSSPTQKSVLRYSFLQILDVSQQSTPVIKPVAAGHIIPGAGYRVVVLMHVTTLLPFLKKQGIRLRCELPLHFRLVIVTQPEVHQVIHRSPDSPAPIVLIFERGIVPCDGGNDPLSPELLRVEQMVPDHHLSLLRRSRFREQGIEIGRRQAGTELPGA